MRIRTTYRLQEADVRHILMAGVSTHTYLCGLMLDEFLDVLTDAESDDRAEVLEFVNHLRATDFTTRRRKIDGDEYEITVFCDKPDLLTRLLQCLASNGTDDNWHVVPERA